MDYFLIDEFSRTRFPKNEIQVQYGTAGFRTKAEHLVHVLYRMGILAALRSKCKNAAIGLMITASHNEESDNGVKLVDPSGEMLESAWEKIADTLANVPDDELIQTLKDIIEEQNINENADAIVVVGKDTRKSGPMLLEAATRGIELSKGSVRNFDLVTTPQLHYLVVCTNNKGDATIPGYISKLSNAFINHRNSQDKKFYQNQLYIDAANGVGAMAAEDFKKSLSDYININIFNNGDGILNYKCGADYVKINQAVPLNSPTKPNCKCISIDGDADRIIYYYVDESGKIHVLDGDKIAILIISYLKELIIKTGLSIVLGLVQTAYANGASSFYASEVLCIPIAFTKTGVKYLHHQAQKFDIGVYFEANGHGTVVFKDEIVQQIHAASKNQTIPEENRSAAKKLTHFIDMINQTVGDALSDMLVIESILYEKDVSLELFDQIYTDLPNKQLKVKVKDRNIVTTTDAERRCVTPAGLQEKIDAIMSTYHRGFAFVRPSGTEDIVRVYAECEDPSKVNELAAKVALLVYQLADGVGPAPVVPDDV